MTKPVIHLRNLRVSAGRRIILAIDELSVGCGEVFAVIGPNGAGKSTLAKACLGLQPSRGEILVLDQPVNRLRTSALCRLRRRIGYVPQMLAQRSELPLTLREVVAIGRTGIAGLCVPLKKNDWRIVDEWIDRMGMSHLAGLGYCDLSGGEQRKGLIAKAMVQKPDILMLDEPTANLDLSWRERIVETLQHLYEQTHVTTVLICHELEVIPPCCRRMVLLENGNITACGKPRDILTDERVASLYGPHMSVVHAGGRVAIVPASMGVQS